jgi:carboxy-terminal domain RNA polymerase II polypeptide A small phosphatase
MPAANQVKLEPVGDSGTNASFKETHQDKENGKPENSSLSSTISGNKPHINSASRADASATLRSLTTPTGSGNHGATNSGKAPRPSFLSRLIYLLVPCVSPSRAHIEESHIIIPPTPSGRTNDKDTPQKYNENKIPESTLRPLGVSSPEEDIPEKISDTQGMPATPSTPLQANVESGVDEQAPADSSPKPDLDNVLSGGVQQPGSGLDKGRAQDSNQNGVAEESEGSSFTEDDDLDDMNGMDEVDDEEDRLILNGGTGIPVGPVCLRLALIRPIQLISM